MSLQYQMEWGLGRRGRRVVRRLGGPRAWVLAVVDLALSLAFGAVELAARLAWAVVAGTLKLAWRGAVALMTLAVALVASPFRLARRLASRPRDARPARVKPAWVGLDEL